MLEQYMFLVVFNTDEISISIKHQNIYCSTISTLALVSEFETVTTTLCLYTGRNYLDVSRYPHRVVWS